MRKYIRAGVKKVLPAGWFESSKRLRAYELRLTRVERNLRNLLNSDHQALMSDVDQKTRMRSREFGIYSQNGEDGILLDIFSHIGVTTRRFLEIGVETGRECNTANFSLSLGWRGLLIEGHGAFASAASTYYGTHTALQPGQVEIAHEFITADNINDVLERYGHVGEIDLLSIDIDGNDYWIWKAITAISPRVVIIEYNASFGPNEARVVPYVPSFNRWEKHPSGWYHGASISALYKLGHKKDYLLACCESKGVNAIFIRRDVGQRIYSDLAPGDAYYEVEGRTEKMRLDEQWHLIKDMPYELV